MIVKKKGRMTGKRVLITGGTSGIGLATAKRMLQEGAEVAVTGRSVEGLAHARNVLVGAKVFSSDAGNVLAQKDLAQQLRAEFGQLDAVVINAGSGTWLAMEDWDEEDFDNQMAINFKGPFFLLQALRPILAKPASIVLIASVAAHRGLMHHQVYGASKAALLGLMRGLTIEWAPYGIRLNAISPGATDTPMVEKLAGEDADKVRERFGGLVPARRFGTPEEMANAAVFLASDESSYLQGSDIVVDGGLLATFPG